MNIAYVSTYDSADTHAWSGLGYHILKSLQNSGLHTETIGNLKNRYRLRATANKIVYRLLFSKRFIGDCEPAHLKDLADQTRTALERIPHDIVFSPGTFPLSYLQTEKPVVFWADATFAGMIDFYPGYHHLCPKTVRNGNTAEQLALSRCRLAIYCSEWAADTALHFYDVDPAKVKVVPFGANIADHRTLQDITTILACKSFTPCKLLFMGVDWQRKGGEIALMVAKLLNQRGIPTELHIAGCVPPGKLPDYVKSHGFISKTTRGGRELFNQLMTDAHFLILPSRAECYGVVFAEAGSFGLPSLATNVGGVSSAVREGKNGHLFVIDAPPDQYCDFIASTMSSHQAYQALAYSSFREYTEHLNWNVAGQQVRALLQEFCMDYKDRS